MKCSENLSHVPRRAGDVRSLAVDEREGGAGTEVMRVVNKGGADAAYVDDGGIDQRLLV